MKQGMKVGTNVRYEGPINEDAVRPDILEGLLGRSGTVFSEWGFGHTTGVDFGIWGRYYLDPKTLAVTD